MLPRIIVINREQLNEVILAHLYALSILDDDDVVLDMIAEDYDKYNLDEVTLVLTMKE